MRRLTTLVVTVILWLSMVVSLSCTSEQGVPDVASPETDEYPDTDTDSAAMSATTMSTVMGIGVGIGNTLDNTASWETGWGLPTISRDYINGMAANGIKTVRVPVAWDTYSIDGVVPTDKMARVREVVEMIIDANMFCIVNIHWDGGWINNQGTVNAYRLTDDVRAKYASYWQQISAAFADVGNQLVFEAMDEEGAFWENGTLNGTPDYKPLNELNQLFVNTVRAGTGYNISRNLSIVGFAADIEKTCVDEFIIPADPAGIDKLFLSMHYYTPVSFCCLEEPDVNSGIFPATTWGTEEEQTQLAALFEKLATFRSSRNIPVIMSAFSATVGSGEYVREPDSRVLWMTAVMQSCLNNHFVPLLWDIGTEVYRTNGSFSPEFQQVLSNVGL